MTNYKRYKDNEEYWMMPEDEQEVYRCKYNSKKFREFLPECEMLYIYCGDEDMYAICNKNQRSIHLNWNNKFADEWKDCLKECGNLWQLTIKECSEVPKEILEIRSLRYLELIHCKLEEVISGIYGMMWLEGLVLDRCEISYLSDDICNLTRLELLSIMSTKIAKLPETLAQLQNLKYLGLNGTRINEVPNVVFELTQLESLYLGQTQIDELPNEIVRLKQLKELAIWETKLKELPECICLLENLEGLYLGRTKGIEFLPEQIGNLSQLKRLFLDGTGLRELPNSFKKLVNLEELILSKTNIHSFPEMGIFKNLKRCELCGLSLERIPKEFIYTDLEIYLDDEYREDGLVLTGTKLLCQPISLFTHDKDFIYAYYEEEKIHLNETKVVFLGDGEAGKSHIIRRIFEEGKTVEAIEYKATPGIDIVPKQCEIDSEYMNLQLWDFGGQDILHSMHRFFLTDRTLYVIVVNARDNTQNERARYWLNNVKSFADGCPVIIVLNKMDQNESAGLNETLLKNDYPQINEILKMSALLDEKDKFDHLTEKIFETVKTFDSYAMEFPVSWNKIKSTLIQMQCNYIVDQKYREICENNGVEDIQIQNWLLEWFHDLGVSFNYRKKDAFLGGYMVLKPQWITNAIYIILFNAKPYAINGVISKNDIVRLLENPPKAVENIKYNILEVPYIIEVLRRFDISYKIDDEHEFIPMLCNENEYENVKAFIEESCLQYIIKYQYLPNNVLHKLMIRMRDDLQKDKIWLTGMMLKGRENLISAVVRIHESKLEIYIKSSNHDVATPKEYLSEIRGHLSKINGELGLDATDMIVYREEKTKEEIRYDDLLVYLRTGRKNYFSTILRKEIPVKKILGTVETNVEHIQWLIENKEQITEEEIRLILLNLSQASYVDFENELLMCCNSLQGNYLERTQGKENDRNTYVRDLLRRSNKYIVHDQTLNGSSPVGKTAGELDLKICINRNGVEEPLSIVEALNLSGIRSAYIKQHIDKIYCYDTWGAKYNYLVIYAHTSNFGKFCARYEKFLAGFAFPLEVEKAVEEREVGFHSEIRVYDTTLKRNGKKTMITHVIVNMGK